MTSTVSAAAKPVPVPDEASAPFFAGALHGKLIALGLLSFEISGKLGMRYQLSPLGRRTLGRVDEFEEPSSDESADLPTNDSEDAELEAAELPQGDRAL